MRIQIAANVKFTYSIPDPRYTGGRGKKKEGSLSGGPFLLSLRLNKSVYPYGS
jgi:hypothetical protein